jgi:hypothetical protein
MINMISGDYMRNMISGDNMSCLLLSNQNIPHAGYLKLLKRHSHKIFTARFFYMV